MNCTTSLRGQKIPWKSSNTFVEVPSHFRGSHSHMHGSHFTSMKAYLAFMEVTVDFHGSRWPNRALAPTSLKGRFHESCGTSMEASRHKIHGSHLSSLLGSSAFSYPNASPNPNPNPNPTRPDPTTVWSIGRALCPRGTVRGWIGG